MRRRKTTTLVVGAAVAASAVAAPALAAAVAQATAGATTSAGSWAASLGPSAGPAATGPHVISFAAGGIVPSYFRVFSTGTLALTGSSWLAVNSKPSGNAPPTIALTACVGADWSTALGTCSGTQVSLTNSDLTVANPVALALPAGSSVHVRAAGTRLLNFPQAFSTTVSVSVARSQVAPATTRSS